MKKIILYSLILLAVGVTITSCFPQDENVYSGPSVVEFKNHTLGITSTVLTARGIVTSPASQVQTDSTRYILQSTRLKDTVYVQLVGPQVSTPTVVNFTVRATSDAVEGTHFTFSPAATRTVTIPANSSVGYIIINTIPASVASGAVKGLFLDLVGAGAILPSANYSKFKVYIKG